MSADNAEEIADRPGGVLPPQPCRPTVMATRYAVAAGHYLATHAAFEVLEAGGNAIDAGVAAGLALGVLESEPVSVAGVAPIMIYLADSREVITISGLGTWPIAASCAYFQDKHGGAIPKGVERTVVPGGPRCLDHGAREVRHHALRRCRRRRRAPHGLCPWRVSRSARRGSSGCCRGDGSG